MLSAAYWLLLMARSKHTAPRRILVAKRVRAPYASRGAGDARTQQRHARVLKESGLPVPPPPVVVSGNPLLPKILVQHARAGWLHPASRTDIKRVLCFFGESCFYGLRSIELRQASSNSRQEALLFGQLVVPGRIIIYEQKPSPWLIRGVLPTPETAWLRQAGAEVLDLGQCVQTKITWPRDTLRDFMLFEVLMHEVGHHLIQHHKGKRTMRTARTRDHEAFASRFAQRCRQLYHQPFPS